MPRQRIDVRALISVGLLITASLACNMQASSQSPNVQAAPVIFIGPEANASIAEGATIVFAVKATDNTSGIAKVEFTVDDVVIGSQTAATVLNSFTARQPWKAAGIQGHFVNAVAFRADGTPIGRADMTITVVQGVALAITGTASGTTSSATLAVQPTTASKATLAPTLAPTNRPAPTVAATILAPQPTANTSGQAPTIQVLNTFINVRTGPGTTYQIITKLNQGDTAPIIGRNDTSTWWAIQLSQGAGWVINDQTLIKVIGDTSQVHLAQSDAAPIQPTVTVAQGLAPTSTVGPVADLVFGDVTISQPNPVANDTLTVTAVIRNQGQLDASSSYLAGIFQPGNEHSDTAVGPIKAGESVTVQWYVTIHSSGANQTGQLTLDFRNEIAEGSVGEANNVKTITYSVGG